MIEKLRNFPAVEELLQHADLATAVADLPRPVAAQIVREVVARTKKNFRESRQPLAPEALLADIRAELVAAKRHEITRVINATGIVVHTNLGRAPLSESLFDAIKNTVTGYGNIEFDLSDGKRGRRGLACERYLAQLAGAEAATVVNNCAAALFLMLNTFANRKRVLISRGELVQIGGGFRIPDILEKSGAKLCEVGTTNITTVGDYERAIAENRNCLILKVHKSNFVQGGFTEEVSLKELVALGAKHDVMVINDLGSGVFVDTRDLLGYSEPTVNQSVQAGAHLTSFSGDKLLGGAQAGLIVGGAELIARIKKNPLFRTMRVDKIVFSILEHLFALYLDDCYRDEIKLWRTLAIPESELYRRARQIMAAQGHPDRIAIEATRAFVGGGALPEAAIPSVGLVFTKDIKATALSRKFRALAPPVIGRIENDRFILDLKTVDEQDMPFLVKSIRSILESPAC